MNSSVPGWFSFMLNLFKEARSIKKSQPALHIGTAIRIIADESFNPESFFVDLFSSNNSSEPISIYSFGLVSMLGEEFLCAIDDFGAVGGYTLATPMPITILPGEAKRIILEFNYDDRSIKYIRKLNHRSGKRMYLRAHTNRGDLGTLFWSNFVESMEGWYSSRSIAMKQASHQKQY